MSTKLKDSFAYSISKAERKAEFVNKKQMTIVPAPGYVFPNDVFSTKHLRPISSSINRNDRYRQERESKRPGPTSYNLPSKLIEKPQYVFGLRPFIDP